MKFVKQIFFFTLLVMVVNILHPGVSWALMTDQKHGKWNLIGKFKPQVTFRTESVPPNNPIPIKAGDITSQRNLLMLEFKHNLGDVLPDLQVEYYLQGRTFYDSAWDYGPDVLSSDETRREYCFDNRHQINDLKWDADLFMTYIDLTSGPSFTRIGRQVMAWGEMSTIRILDGTNPMDTSSLAVDLMERLVPLWMVRSNLAFDYVGPFDSISLEAYYIPGKIDNTNGEDMIDGSPIIPNVGRDLKKDLEDPMSLASLKQIMNMVDDDIDSDRYGIKFGLMFKGLDLNFAYYRMYSDVPVARINADALSPITIDPDNIDMNDIMGSVLGGQKLEVVLDVDEVDVFGISFNYLWDLIDTVIRGEAAIYKDVPKMPPGSINAVIAAFAPKVTIQGMGSINELIALFPLGDIEKMVLPFTAGDIPKYDVWKYGIGFDKWAKIPFLNTEDFMFTFEYVGSKIMDYKKKAIMSPWQAPWDDDRDGQYDTVWEPEYSNTFVFITNTYYLSGNLMPQLVAMYEVEPKALVLIPSLEYDWKNLQFELSYFCTESDEYEGTMGMLDSRDEVTFSITYNF